MHFALVVYDIDEKFDLDTGNFFRFRTNMQREQDFYDRSILIPSDDVANTHLRRTTPPPPCCAMSG
jgi:hypothetical protein